MKNATRAFVRSRAPLGKLSTQDISVMVLQLLWQWCTVYTCF